MEIGLLTKLIMGSKSIVVFTGTGVSLESGIDLRTMWSENDLYDLSGQNLPGDPESRRSNGNY